MCLLNQAANYPKWFDDVQGAIDGFRKMAFEYREVGALGKELCRRNVWRDIYLGDGCQ